MRSGGSHAVLALSSHDTCGSPEGDAVLSVTGTTRSWNIRGIGGVRVGALRATIAARLPPL